MVYHEEACCSLSIPNLAMSMKSILIFGNYLEDSRNILKVKKTATKQRLLRRNRMEVVGFLCNLPQTEHDLNCMTVDVIKQTESMLCFSVQGYFKEVGQSFNSTIRAFYRTFVLVPGSSGSIYIINDQMVIKSASHKQVQKAFSKPAVSSGPDSAGSSDSLPCKYDEMITTLSQNTGMNTVWAQKCLQENDWNFKQATEVFNYFKGKGAVPLEAFKM
ncbi:nuclear RNA export factor 1-like [Protopterus annectens]|uniref:nuclear RNA export factor 1-like n=1 Tax=Protopterus annectens TaxID=7888 RepID=UPI001CFBD0AA|nr:nuclear RNA export factor 1-like [Protopterus annectens]